MVNVFFLLSHCFLEVGLYFIFFRTLFFKVRRIAHQKEKIGNRLTFQFLIITCFIFRMFFLFGKERFKRLRNWTCKNFVILWITESAPEHPFLWVHFRARLESECDHILRISGWHTSFRPLCHGAVSTSPDFPSPLLIKQQGSFFLAL